VDARRGTWGWEVYSWHDGSISICVPRALDLYCNITLTKVDCDWHAQKAKKAAVAAFFANAFAYLALLAALPFGAGAGATTAGFSAERV